MIKKNADLKKEERGKQRLWTALIVSVVFIVLIIVLIFTIRFTNDPKNVALSISDLPKGYVMSTDPNQTGYKGDSFWPNETYKQYALDHGFKKGYFNNFFYTNPETGILTTVISSISYYNVGNISQVFNNSKKFLENENCTYFDAPGKWINSYGCYLIYGSPVGELKEYHVIFFEKDVFAEIVVSQNDTSADLSGTAVKYAQIVADKI